MRGERHDPRRLFLRPNDDEDIDREDTGVRTMHETTTALCPSWNLRLD